MERKRKQIALTVLALLLTSVLTFSISLLFRKQETETVSLESAVTETTAPTQPTTEVIMTETQPPTFAPIEIPDAVQLEVPYISQKNLLPTGCELISAQMLLAYHGVETTIEEIVDNTRCAVPVTINGQNVGCSPFEAFIGSPWDASSFGCFPPVVVEMMNKLLPQQLRAADISGMELAEIAQTYLTRNMPVLIWATIGMIETYPSIGWYLTDADGEPTEEWYEWPANEHCLVLVGYDSTHYYFNDPYNSRGLVSYSRERAETRYAEMGKMAAVVMESQYVH